MRRSREAAVLLFFRDASLPVVEVVYGLVQDVMRERKKERKEADRTIKDTVAQHFGGPKSSSPTSRKRKVVGEQGTVNAEPLLGPPPGVLP